MKVRLERRLSSSGHLLLLQRTWDWIPAPTMLHFQSWGTIPSSGIQQHQEHEWCIHTYSCTHIKINKSQENKIMNV